MGHETLWQAMTEKEAILESADTEFDADRYAALEDIVVSLDGYSFEARSGEILEGLGIPSEQHRQPLSTLSGGFKLRVLLARVLASNPDCLFLDEPTNHLDILSIRWLEKFLLDFPGCAVVISHDHRFLNNVCTHILDVDYETVTLYTGNFSRLHQGQDAGADPQGGGNRQTRRRKSPTVSPLSTASEPRTPKPDRLKARSSRSKSWSSNRLPRSSRRYPIFTVSQQRPSGKQVIEIEAHRQVLWRETGSEQCLPQPPPWRPTGGDRAERNRQVDPAQDHHGSSRCRCRFHRVGPPGLPGYFAQDHRELLSESEGTVEGLARRRLRRLRPSAGCALNSPKCLFSGDEVEKRVASLSGGEAARLIFARLAVDHPNVLVLDEPTNHLDLEAIEALVESAQGVRRHSHLCRSRPLVRIPARDPHPRDHPPTGSTTTPGPTTSTSPTAATTTSMSTPRPLRAKREQQERHPIARQPNRSDADEKRRPNRRRTSVSGSRSSPPPSRRPRRESRPSTPRFLPGGFLRDHRPRKGPSHATGTRRSPDRDREAHGGVAEHRGSAGGVRELDAGFDRYDPPTNVIPTSNGVPSFALPGRTADPRAHVLPEQC